MTSLIKGITALMIVANSLTITDIASPVLEKQHSYYTNPVLEIPKININKELYPNDKTKNTVDKNIEVIEGSQMPTKKHSNLILASHSGTSEIAYFKNLHQLQHNDNIYIYYKNKKYKYVIEDIYDVQKTGYVEIKRLQSKNTVTLITCKKNTNLQTVYIGYLVKEEKIY